MDFVMKKEIIYSYQAELQYKIHQNEIWIKT